MNTFASIIFSRLASYMNFPPFIYFDDTFTREVTYTESETAYDHYLAQLEHLKLFVEHRKRSHLIFNELSVINESKFRSRHSPKCGCKSGNPEDCNIDPMDPSKFPGVPRESFHYACFLETFCAHMRRTMGAQAAIGRDPTLPRWYSRRLMTSLEWAYSQ